MERQNAADMAEGLRDEIAQMEQVLRGYEADIAKLQGKLREARARQNAISARFESAVTRAKAREMMHGSRTAEAFSKFEVLERRADFAEGRCDALGIGSLEDEIEQLQRIAGDRSGTGRDEGRAESAGCSKGSQGHDPQDLSLFARPPRREGRRRLLDHRQASSGSTRRSSASPSSPCRADLHQLQAGAGRSMR